MSKRKQHGLTIIELMIAILIGAILITVVMGVFITTNRSVSMSDGLSRNQEAGRFAMEYLQTFIEMAGYYEAGMQRPNALFMTDSSYTVDVTCTTGTAEADACSANNVDAVRGDRLAIKFAATETHSGVDCTGAAVNSDADPIAKNHQHVVNVFWVNANNELVCRVYDHDPDDASGSGWRSAEAPILSNVESFQFLVGIAATEDDKSPARFVSIDEVANHALVRAIRIGVLVSSSADKDQASTNTLQQSFTLLGEALPTANMDDGRLRHIFTNTISPPNLQAM